MQDLAEDALSDSDDEDDEDFVPQARKKKKRRRRRVRPPDLRELSMPKPARLDATLDLGDAALAGCSTEVVKGLSSLSSPIANVVLLPGRRPTRGTPAAKQVVEFSAIYSVQLPGMPFYHDAFHALLTNGPDGSDIAGEVARLNLSPPAMAVAAPINAAWLARRPRRRRRDASSARTQD